MNPDTDSAPASLSANAAALNVEPLVTTSSKTRIRFEDTSRITRKCDDAICR